MTADTPDKIWANSQEWPKGSGRIEVYASATFDQDDPATAYTRTDLADAAITALTAENARLAAANAKLQGQYNRAIAGWERCLDASAELEAKP